VFVIDLASRRVQIVGSTPFPNDVFMSQVGRTLTEADEGILVGHRVLLCDRDRKWSREVRRLLSEGGVQVVQTPFQAPNANAYAERFVRSIKYECLDRIVPWASVTFGGGSQNSSGIIIANETTKGSRIGSSRGARLFAARDKFVGVRGSVACSIITSERRDNQRLRPDLRSAQIWDTTGQPRRRLAPYIDVR
jgi:transposase InsO family protein